MDLRESGGEDRWEKSWSVPVRNATLRIKRYVWRAFLWNFVIWGALSLPWYPSESHYLSGQENEERREERKEEGREGGRESRRKDRGLREKGAV